MEIGNLNENDINSNDSKDDPRSWEKNGGKLKREKNGLKRARIFKEQTEMNYAKTEMKNTLEGINGRIKKQNENRPVSETSRTILNTSTFAL